MSILVEAAVPHFGEPELPLDNTKLVFHLCPDAGLVPVPGALVISQCPVAAALGLGEVFCLWRAIGDGFSLAGIGGIAPHPGLFPVQQVRQYLGVVYVGRGGDHRMNQLGAAVYADMGLHAEVPLVARASGASPGRAPSSCSWSNSVH